jgi:hypothetical protein
MSIDAIENFKLTVNDDDKGGATAGNRTNLNIIQMFPKRKGKILTRRTMRKKYTKGV